MASSIALAWCMSTAGNADVVSLIQTPRGELRARPENLYVLSLVGINAEDPQFLCLDDIPEAKRSPFPSHKFALVDHNRLLPQFVSENPPSQVVAVIDHHEDEGFYKDADPRIIVVPTGSATSLVSLYIKEKSTSPPPPELATLLLCGILIDTDGLKPGGKAEDQDHQAATFLVPISLLPPGIDDQKLPDDPVIRELTRTLEETKRDVSHLTTRELFQRDYKEYTMVPHWAKDTTVLVGLASVPVALKPWFEKDKEFFPEMDKFMSDRGLAAFGVLTSFHDPKKLNKEGKPKHKREQLWGARKGDGGLKDLPKILYKGLKKSKELDLKAKSFKRDYGVKKKDGFDKTIKGKVFRQMIAKASRKVIAPVVKDVIEGTSVATSGK